MQPIFDHREVIACAIGEAHRRARALLPFLLAPCLPAIVACSTADLRAEANIPITSAVVARSGLPPLLLRPISERDAVALNRRIPFSAEPQVAAQPFAAGTDEAARGRALECLTSAIYYEASGESDDGERAVAQVILNRVRHPAFPGNVCGVVFQGSTLPTGCQFSFTCDGSLQRLPSRKEWDRARAIATAALAGAVYAPVGLATHYHADYVVPYWAPSLAKASQVGAHIFYRWAGSWGRPPSFTQRYANESTDLASLRNVALLSHGVWPGAVLPEQPRLTLTIDPAVELDGVVRVLASAPAVGGAFERQIRSYFHPDLAAPVLALLAGPKPTPTETPAAAPAPETAPAAQPAVVVPASVAAEPPAPSLKQLIADFARQSKFTAFMRLRRAFYKANADQVQHLAETAAIDWETYSGLAVPGGKAVLSLAQGASDRACPALLPRKLAGPVLHWPSATPNIGPAEIFIRSGFADHSLGTAPTRGRARAKKPLVLPAPLRDEIVAAVFARVAALSRSEEIGGAVVQSELARGHTLVPLLAQRLRFFETHRSEYATLDDFLPALIGGLPANPAVPHVGPDPAAASPLACEI